MTLGCVDKLECRAGCSCTSTGPIHGLVSASYTSSDSSSSSSTSTSQSSSSMFIEPIPGVIGWPLDFREVTCPFATFYSW
ncbi:hypothetical protein M405DRAFT_806494 [Rhizopogon salebrosus TDB-379]|nr:hypothetical protein M405DRAFT_806494 [Rhizopogon salebrosus TDB-379]